LRRIGMDVPVALGLLVTFVASTGATFDPGGRFGHEVYFDSMAMFVFFLLGGRWFELRARHRAAEVLESALQGLPDTAIRVDAAGGVETVPVSRLRVGDRVRVPAGQVFVADGVLLDGPTHVDEALLTGESTPLSRGMGDSVCTGSVNLRSPVHMSVQRLGADTRHAGIVALVREAMVQRPATVVLADRMAAPFLWGVLVLAVMAAAAWSTIEPDRAVWVAVSVLIVTCPCALALATPASLLAASGALAKRGVLLRRLDALESLAKVDTVVFDKTGTLTEDRLELVETRVLEAGASAEYWLGHAASLAVLSTHPLSQALAAAGKPVSPAVWRDVEEHPGQGLRARAEDGAWFRLGRRDWVDAQGADRAPNEQIWFGPEGHAAACFTFAEAQRADAAATVQRLRDAGLRVALLSGDSTGRVQALATRLGIDDVQAAATPEDKLVAIARWQQDGHCVAMVGDGLNDAPVLARADVSFAFAHGASVSQAHADAVLLGGRLADVADARDHALRTVKVMRQNLAWAAIYNATCVPLALAGMLPPWAAGLGMAASSLGVVLNAGRLARLPRRD
jgi:Cu2+-exporting ATPase